jgi:hypothetical protein
MPQPTYGVQKRRSQRPANAGAVLISHHPDDERRGRQLRRPYFFCSGWSAAFCASKSSIMPLIRPIVSWSLIESDILRYRRSLSSNSAHLSHMVSSAFARMSAVFGTNTVRRLSGEIVQIRPLPNSNLATVKERWAERRIL